MNKDAIARWNALETHREELMNLKPTQSDERKAVAVELLNVIHEQHAIERREHPLCSDTTSKIVLAELAVSRKVYNG